ncbi:hypothetical protein GCM10027346_11090 [Hymenobacter seoulensis]
MLIPFVAALMWWKHLSAPLRILGSLAGFMVLMFVLLRLAAYLWHQNMIIAHLCSVGETIFYLAAFRHVLKFPVRWFTLILASFLVFALLDTLVWEGLEQLNSYTIVLESFIGICLVLLFLDKKFRTSSSESLLEQPLIIAGIGIILYLNGTVSVYIISNTYISTNDVNSIILLFALNSIMLMIMAAFFTYAFYVAKKKATFKPVQILALP